MRDSRRGQRELAPFLVTVAGVAVIGIVVAFLIRLQRGLLGVILSAVAVALLAYWLSEVRSLLKREVAPLAASTRTVPKASTLRDQREPIDETWIYDLYETKRGAVLVARVPGPEKDVRVVLSEGVLKILGGHGFVKSINVPEIGSIEKTAYKNGVLVVELAKKIEQAKDGRRDVYAGDAE